MYAVLGRDLEFDVISLRGMENSINASYIEHPLVLTKPILEAVGVKLETRSLEIVLRREFCDVASKIQLIKRVITEQKPLSLVFENGDYLGYWVITDMTNSVLKTSDVGAIVSAQISISLLEYAGEVDDEADDFFDLPTSLSSMIDLVADGLQTVVSVVTNICNCANDILGNIDSALTVDITNKISNVMAQVGQFKEICNEIEYNVSAVVDAIDDTAAGLKKIMSGNLEDGVRDVGNSIEKVKIGVSSFSAQIASRAI